MMIIGKILRMGRRQLHTIISREIIKPSSPTPSHLKTYNLSKLDQFSTHYYVPLLLYYPHNETCSLTPNEKARELMKSLSQSLTQYYPFAGRLHSPTSPYMNCNDEGVVFVEAKNDSQMNMFQHISDDDETVGQLFVDGLFWWQHYANRPNLLAVQVNHFACGGIAVALTMSHIIGDACTFGSFLSHWASVARYGSIDHKHVLTFNPLFIQFPATTGFHPPPPEAEVLDTKCLNPVCRRFVFPNSKLSELKNKVVKECGSTLSINKPTRVEVLTSLIYKTATTAWAARSLSFKTSILLVSVNVRDKFVPKQPPTAVGNLGSGILVTTKDENEASLSVLVSKLQKGKMELESVKSMKLARENVDLAVSKLRNELGLDNNADYRSFLCASICGFPFNKVDFGWGTPAAASITFRCVRRTGSVLIDTPNGDGIEAWVTLEAEDMERFHNDKELMSFCQN